MFAATWLSEMLFDGEKVRMSNAIFVVIDGVVVHNCVTWNAYQYDS
jgi:hypothetical protein